MATRPSAAEVAAYLQEIGFSPLAAYGIVGNLVVESGNFDPNVISGGRRGDSGSAVGIMQWRGARFANLQRYARDIGQDWRDWKTQALFIKAEMVHPQYSDPGSKLAMQELAKAKNLREATGAFMHAERPAGYSRSNPYNGMHFDRRLQAATQVAGGEQYNEVRNESYDKNAETLGYGTNFTSTNESNMMRTGDMFGESYDSNYESTSSYPGFGFENTYRDDNTDFSFGSDPMNNPLRYDDWGGRNLFNFNRQFSDLNFASNYDIDYGKFGMR